MTKSKRFDLNSQKIDTPESFNLLCHQKGYRGYFYCGRSREALSRLQIDKTSYISFLVSVSKTTAIAFSRQYDAR